MRNRIFTAESMSEFLLGGNSTFTLLNRETGNRYTYKATRKKDGDIYWVKLLNGSDNTRDYRFFGTLFPTQDSGYSFLHSYNGRVGSGSRSVLTFRWFMKRLRARTPFPSVFEFWHEGRCGRCGRKLTVPESLSVGFGPECIKRLAA